MRKLRWLFLAAFLFAVLPLLAQGDIRFGLPPESPENARTKALLKKPIDVQFDKTPFDMAVDFLREVGNINIVIDERALGGRRPSEIPVTLRLRQVPLGTVLDFLTMQVGLRYAVRKGVVYISDSEGAREPLYLVTFDIRDLIVRVPDFAGPTLGISGAPGEEIGETGRRVEQGRRGLQRRGREYSPSRRRRTYYSLSDENYTSALSPDEAGAELLEIIKEMFNDYGW